VPLAELLDRQPRLDLRVVERLEVDDEVAALRPRALGERGGRRFLGAVTYGKASTTESGRRIDDRERRGGAAHRRSGEGGLKVRILLHGTIEVEESRERLHHSGVFASAIADGKEWLQIKFRG
jgi:hypothetical protein